MKVAALVALLGGTLAGALSLLSGQGTAQACSRAPFVAEYIPGAVENSKVVAIGSITSHSERAATLRIDEGMKGAVEGDTFEVDNRTTYTGMACSPYDETFHEGFRFRTGDWLVIMLEKEVDGLWQVSFGAWAAWPVPEDNLEPMNWDAQRYDPGFASFSELKPTILANLSALNSDPGFESRTPCNSTRELENRMRTATAVVIAEVAPGLDVQHARVLEVLGGSVEKEVTVNFRVRRSYENCDLVVDKPLSELRYTRSGRFLLFLRPDESGEADYRPALWGSAAIEANERWITYGYPTLRDIRAAVAREEGQSPNRPPVTSSPGPAGATNSNTSWFIAAGVILATMGMLGFVSRHRRARR